MRAWKSEGVVSLDLPGHVGNKYDMRSAKWPGKINPATSGVLWQSHCILPLQLSSYMWFRVKSLPLLGSAVRS